MQTPDFAMRDWRHFPEQDLRFLFEHFPAPGVDTEQAVQQALAAPAMLETLLDSAYLHAAVTDRDLGWLQISPRLYFEVLLRHEVPRPRDAATREAIHYLAHVLALFADADRVHRIQPEADRAYEYLVDLSLAASRADAEHAFLIHVHMGNYAMFMSGFGQDWLEYRFRYGRRAVSLDYYVQSGRAAYATAARDRRADHFSLRSAFTSLAATFERYRGGLARIAAAQAA